MRKPYQQGHDESDERAAMTVAVARCGEGGGCLGPSPRCRDAARASMNEAITQRSIHDKATPGALPVDQEGRFVWDRVTTRSAAVPRQHHL